MGSKRTSSLRVSQRGNYLAWFDPRDTIAEPIDDANQFLPRRKGQRRRFGMNPLGHDVGQGNARGQHAHRYLAGLRLRALLFHQPKFLGTAVVINDDATVSHWTFPRLPGHISWQHGELRD